ncbi:MAG: ABC transporter permease [Candidatus Aquicultor sp.]
MNLSRILAIARKQFLTLRHDPRTLALMLLAPIMAMLIFGFAFGTQPKHIRVTVVNQDNGPLAAELVDRIDHTTLDIAESKDVEAAKNQVRDGKKVAAIIFPPDFTENASARVSVSSPGSGPPSPPVSVAPAKGAHAQVFLDTTNQQLSFVTLLVASYYIPV